MVLLPQLIEQYVSFLSQNLRAHLQALRAYLRVGEPVLERLAVDNHVSRPTNGSTSNHAGHRPAVTPRRTGLLSLGEATC